MGHFEKYLQQFASVDGWFPKPAIAIWDILLTYQREHGIKGNLLEIGVWKGKSAGLAALHCGQEESCILVDPLSLDEARAHIGRAAPQARCLYLQEESQFLYRHSFLNESARKFRWIHVDGEHTGQSVINDLAIANLLLSERGILSVDDFFAPAYPQVTQAVFQFLTAHPGELSLVLCGFGKGYICRPKAAREYLRFLQSALFREMAERGCDQVTVWKTTEPGDMNTFGITDRYLSFEYRGPDWDPSHISV
ncbi:MAG: class I SAM-dependent methyltransferase [Deltaproteobacteria bacterium]|nr:class I SAM-dependent methyltransferase [Deltaproteobacteria bacterium]